MRSSLPNWPNFANSLSKLMSAIFNLTLPFFALVGFGYLAKRLSWLPQNGVAAINVFVFNFAMPALVINALGRQDFSSLIDVRFMAGWFLAAALIFAIGMIIGRIVFGGGIREMALSGQAASIGNLGFLALPLLLSVVGDKVAAPVSAALIIDLVILIPVSIAMLESGGGAGGSFAAALARALKGAFVNPFFLAIAGGVFLSASGIGLPGPTDRFISFLAGAAGPAALFSLGASLAGRTLVADALSIGILSVLKLIAHPLAAYIILSALGVTGETLAIGVVLAAMPIAGNVFVIAEAYATMVKRLSAAILISTVIAVVTVAVALQIMGFG